MSRTGNDWRQERARQRRRVEAVNASGRRLEVDVLLAGGDPCTECAAYAVRYSARDDERRCAECGAAQPRPAA